MLISEQHSSPKSLANNKHQPKAVVKLLETPTRVANYLHAMEGISEVKQNEVHEHLTADSKHSILSLNPVLIHYPTLLALLCPPSLSFSTHHKLKWFGDVTLQ